MKLTHPRKWQQTDRNKSQAFTICLHWVAGCWLNSWNAFDLLIWRKFCKCKFRNAYTCLPAHSNSLKAEGVVQFFEGALAWPKTKIRPFRFPINVQHTNASCHVFFIWNSKQCSYLNDGKWAILHFLRNKNTFELPDKVNGSTH